MQHANILPRHNMDQLTSLDVSDLNKIGLKCKNIWIRKSKRIGISLPGNLPVRPSTPAIPVDEKREIAIVQEELAIHPLNMDRLHVFLPCDEIKRGIGLVQ